MFSRLFRRASASNAALCVPQSETTEGWLELQEAQDRIAQLEVLLRAQVVELDRYRLLATSKAPEALATPAESGQPAKATRTRKIAAPKADKPVKAAKLSALEFWRLHGEAVDAIRAVYGDDWHLAPHGKTTLVTLPTKFRSYLNSDGVKIVRCDKGARVPSAEFWMDGTLPSELAISPDPERVTERGVNPIPHDDAWHIRHGYAYFKGIPSIAVVKGGVTTKAEFPAGWVHDLEMPSLEARRLAVLAQRAAHKALKRACLEYGPQPAVPAADDVDDIKLAAD